MPGATRLVELATAEQQQSLVGCIVNVCSQCMKPKCQMGLGLMTLAKSVCLMYQRVDKACVGWL